MEVDLGETEDVREVVVTTLEARDHRVAATEPRRVVTGWELERDGASTRRGRFIVTWDGDPPEPVTIYVRHEQQTMRVDQGESNPWGPVTHDMGAQQALLEAITDRLQPDSPVDE